MHGEVSGRRLGDDRFRGTVSEVPATIQSSVRRRLWPSGRVIRRVRPERVPEPRRRALSSDKFWALMDCWDVPTERALSLIGRKSSSVREGFRLSDEQAEVLSRLLEIELPWSR
jgi:hypothetical protein